MWQERISMEKKEEALQDMDVLVRKRKWKNRLGFAAVVAIVIAIAAVSLGSYMRTRQSASPGNMDDSDDTPNTNGNRDRESDMVMATGTTSVGINAVIFEIDFLEDTNLYVEEVYLANGDSVEAGDKYIKFTQESIAEAREELKSEALSAQLAYRSGKISDGESRMQAKYTYDMSVLEAQFAQQVYDDTIAQLDADYAQAVKTYEKAQQEYQEYLERVQNNTFYDDYDIGSLKKAYEEAKELYTDRKRYWEVTDDELKSSSSGSMGTIGNTGSGSSGSMGTVGSGSSENTGNNLPDNAGTMRNGLPDNMGTAGMKILSGIAGNDISESKDNDDSRGGGEEGQAGVKDNQESEEDKQAGSEEDRKGDEDNQGGEDDQAGNEDQQGDQHDSKKPQENKPGEEPGEGTMPDKDANEGASVPNDSADFAGFGSMGRQAGQNVQSERTWIVKTVSLLKQEAEKAEEKYTSALEEYEAEIASVELTLQKLLSRLETAREDFTDAQVAYQKKSLNAKNVYETAVVKGKTAQDDYDTQLASLKDSLDRLQDAREEADSNLALFEELVGDGYLYTEESGTVLMLMAEEGKALAGGSMVFAYSNPEKISVSVSVSQNDIAKLYVGETASVVISDYGNYSGVIETINPISSSNSRTSVSYTVTVKLQGDVGGLDANLTAGVIFGDDAPGTAFDREEDEHGQPGKTGQKTNVAQD